LSLRTLKASIFESNERFVEIFREILYRKSLSVVEFSQIAGIPHSTIYKIISNPEKDFRISTLRDIVNGLETLDGKPVQERTIGVITTRTALDQIGREIQIKGRSVIVKEYPANTIEEEIVQGIKAVNDGVSGIICGPIAATTLEKVVDIPVTSLIFTYDLIEEAVTNILKKLI
jgi:predicted transcriptional regulator